MTGIDATARTHERAGPPASDERKRHPREMEDWLNFHIYHPLANRLAGLLVPTPVTPNMVSFAGWLLIIAATFLYTGLAWPVSVLLAFPVHALWHVFDGADGVLARRTGKSSPIGELVDGVCDYTGHIILYVALAAYLDDQWIGGWAWGLALLSGGSRILQSNHSESQRRTYLWRVYGVPWLKNAYAAGGGSLDKPGLFARIFEPGARLYVALAAATNKHSDRIDALIARCEEQPDGRERVSALCRQVQHTPLKVQTILGPNIRTAALGISMLAGSPLWYFLFEIVPLNLLLAWSRHLQRRADLLIIEHLAA